jgi:hypothetical protein
LMPSRPKPPVPRPTMEVEASWLVSDERAKSDEARATRPRAKKRPPPIPGATTNAPPMPGEPRSVRPPRRVTMEVKAEWLEEVKEPPRKKAPPIPRED